MTKATSVLNCPVKVRHQSNFYGGFYHVVGSNDKEEKIKKSHPRKVTLKKISVWMIVIPSIGGFIAFTGRINGLNPCKNINMNYTGKQLQRL